MRAMLSFLPAPIKGILASAFFALNTLFWCLLLFFFTTLKLCIPHPGTRRRCTRIMVVIAENWISCNSAGIALLNRIRWEVDSLDGLSRDKSYLVCANHQSWIDIVVLQHVFNRRLPFFRFFLKDQLKYVPLLGAAWWALDFPFMKRHSKAYLEKHPEKRGEDLASTRRACERFRGSPISVINFLEGTRFTPAKHRAQQSNYKHLLMPKAGGIAFVLDAMGSQFDCLIDVTIHYPGGAQSLGGLLSGKVRHVIVKVDRRPIPKEVLGGDYHSDSAFRERVQNWVREIWEQKDRRLDGLH